MKNVDGNASVFNKTQTRFKDSSEVHCGKQKIPLPISKHVSEYA